MSLLNFAIGGGTLRKPILTAATVVVAASASFAQNTITVKGVVTDSQKEPLIGVNVKVKGTSQGVATDLNGRFTIVGVAKNAVLELSYVGMQTQTVSVAGQTQLNITMRDDANQLSDVVVVGYGTQKKANLTGAVASVDSKQLASRPTANMTASLQGTVPGVTVIDRPGSGVSLNIRGRGNLGESNPLYIVDGVEVNASYFASLNPNNIENISFLKDAASGAIYGAKAAYGVVLVTTKTARAGHLQISYDGSFGAKSPTYLPDMVSSAQYAELYTLAERNTGTPEASLTFKPEAIEKYRNGSDPDLYPNTNWFDLVLNKQAVFTKHNLQFSGGSDKFKYVLNTGFMQNQALFKKQYTNRYDVSAKTVADLKSWLKITSSVNLIYDDYKRTGGNPSTVELLRVPPTQTAKQSNGEWGSVRNGRTATGEEINANQYRNLETAGRGNSQTTRLLGLLSAEIKPVEWLKITNQIGYNYIDYRSFAFSNTRPAVANFINPSAGAIGASARTENEMGQDWSYSKKLVYDGWVNIDKTFNRVHNFAAMVGVHADSYMTKRLAVGRRLFSSNEMEDLSGGSKDPNKQAETQSYFNEESMGSFFGRLTYNYDNRYLFEANLRADASSRFAKDGRWGYFPSFSAGWRIDKERFMAATSDWLTQLKLRASWGRSGNINNIGLYDTYSTFSTGNTILIGGVEVPYYVEANVGNPNLTWETTTTTDLGLDVSIKGGLFNLTFDYYNRLTDGILVKANDIMTETGLNSSQIPSRNVGKVRNSGIELSLSHRNTLGDFSYEIGGNMTINKNRIVTLGDKVTELPPSGNYIMRVGHSIGDFYMLEANGLYSTEDIASGKYVPYGAEVPEAGMVRFVDQLTVDSDGDGIFDKGDGVINAADRVIVGNDVPRFTYGLNANVSYKGLSLSVMGQGVTGTKVYLSEEASMAFFDNSVPRAWQLNNWTTDNQSAPYPKMFTPSDQRYKYNNRGSSYWLFDASYFRIKNITLSYTLPETFIKKLGLTGARVYFTAENLVTIRGDKRMKDFDPETAGGRGYHMGTKTLTGGLSINF